jgi:hypothetical protein
VDHDIWRGFELVAGEKREIQVDMAHAHGELGFVLTAMDYGDVVTQTAEAADGVGTGETCASEDEYAHG